MIISLVIAVIFLASKKEKEIEKIIYKEKSDKTNENDKSAE